MLRDRVAPGAIIQPDTIEADLARLEDIANRLWPFVRVFCLGGAHPDAIAAVEDLAGYLGHGESHMATEAATKAQQATVRALCNWMRASREQGRWHGKIGRSDFEQLVKDIEEGFENATG
jgi:hypothetical protein